MSKAAIYLRTSTTEQNPEKQLKECKNFADNKGYEIEGVYQEKVSAFKKDVDRPKYKEVKEKARKGEIDAVIVWAFDRWIRNRDTLMEDVTLLKQYDCKLHSVKDKWLEAINIEGSLGRTIKDFLLGLMGSLAEKESRRKSERVKMAYENHNGKWGRPGIPEKTKQEVLELHKQGKSMRQISKEVTYWDKNRNKKNISIGSVHKIIKENE